MVQVPYFEYQGYDRMYKVHDMMREIILLKMDELGFCQILDEKNSRFRSRYRRLSIHGGVESAQEIAEDSGVRSVFIFTADELVQSFVVTLVKKFKLLRLLELRDTSLDHLPKEVGDLFHLKYLGLRNTKVKTAETGKALCGFIEKMINLQRLRLSVNSEDEVLDLQSISSPPCFLRFLTLRGPLVHLPHWMSSLHDLWELRLSFSKLHDEPLRFLHGLPHLQKLFLKQAYDGEELHFNGFRKLKLLSLKNLAELKVLKIDRAALPCLEILEIGASQLTEVPSGIQHLSNLKTLRFHNMPEEYLRGMEPDRGRDYYQVMHASSVTFWEEDDEGVGITKLRESDSYDICCPQHFKIR